MGHACEESSLAITHAQFGGTTLVVWVTNTGQTTESGSLWIDFITATHGPDQIVHTIMNLDPGENEIVTIEFFEPYGLTGYAVCGDIPAISESPDPIDISTERNEDPPPPPPDPKIEEL